MIRLADDQQRSVDVLDDVVVVAQFLFRLALLGDVDHQPPHPQGPAVMVAFDLDVVAHMDDPSASGYHPVLDLTAFGPALDEVVELLDGVVDIGGVDPVHPAVDLAQLVAPRPQDGLDVPGDHEFGGRRDRRLPHDSLDAVEQQCLTSHQRPLPVGNVAHHHRQHGAGSRIYRQQVAVIDPIGHRHQSDEEGHGRDHGAAQPGPDARDRRHHRHVGDHHRGQDR